MRIVFMGTPQFAVPVLSALVEDGHEVVAGYTQPPRPGGRRGRELVSSPVQQRAEMLGIPVRSPVSLKDAAEQEAFGALACDVAVVAAYGLILPRPVLAAPLHGCINVHASLLPRWRGAAPIQRAILAGDEETGVCIMRMEAGLDTGPVLLEGRVPVAGHNAGTLTDELSTLGAALMVEALSSLDTLTPSPQPEEGVTYAAKIDKAEARVDWTQPADAVERLVRAMNPAPGAWFALGDERIKLLAAEVVDGAEPAGTVLDDRLTVACGEGAVRATFVQRAGRGAGSAEELLRGFAIPAGTMLA
ncbi:methionyl-tRNA formyltransferase [Sphingomonas gellani]|uniref:Methionyl-tRNA formyltransferase n=1 Tax=Sphingomonas gellani TaxID=1166340 RepID=A0A1H7ZTI0_9SPHN|nr:methionyl-tRNA formyltransferase [Sphingomonas gellani]SEM61586.1 methionyl-tRNA formyltransferase [Sphingomonas gellani]